MVISPTKPPKGMMLDKQYRAGFSRLAAHGLVCDAMQFQTQLAGACRPGARISRHHHNREPLRRAAGCRTLCRQAR